MKLAKAIRTGRPFRRASLPKEWMGWLTWADRRTAAPKGECSGDHPLSAEDILAQDWEVKA
jgi:hypothetical protein